MPDSVADYRSQHRLKHRGSQNRQHPTRTPLSWRNPQPFAPSDERYGNAHRDPRPSIRDKGRSGRGQDLAMPRSTPSAATATPIRRPIPFPARPGKLAWLGTSARVARTCHLERIASNLQPPNRLHKRLYRSLMSWPLDTSEGAPLRARRAYLQKVAGQTKTSGPS